MQKKISGLLAALCLILLFLSSSCLLAKAEAGDPNEQIVCLKDGSLSDALHIPLDQWYPRAGKPKGVVLAIHGLTLHADCYQVLGKAFADHGFYFCAPDLRGFGRAYADPQHKYCQGGDCKKKVSFEKSYADVVSLAQKLKRTYPDLPLFAMGESLGTSYCVRLAGEHPELVYALILSGPTVKINPLMFLHPATLAAGSFAVLIDPKFRISTKAFVKHLVSNDPNIVAEMLSDPLCRKHMTVGDLLKAGHFVDKTIKYARRIKPEEPVLVLQGSEDRCMVPQAITTLAKNIHSSDQTLRWLHAHGHLLLETAYLRPATVNALAGWMTQHNLKPSQQAETTRQELIKLGAKFAPGERL